MWVITTRYTKASNGWVRLSRWLIVLLVLGCAEVAGAQTVELKDGKCLDGVVTAISSRAVTIEIAGKKLPIARNEIQAIYFGAPAAGGKQCGRGGNAQFEALRVLKGLQSATRGSLSYVDFSPRVTDAKIKVDEFLGAAPDGSARFALADAMELYVYASRAWNRRVAPPSGSNPTETLIKQLRTWNDIWNDPARQKCGPLTERIESRGYTSTEDRGAEVTREESIALLFKCADDRIADAENLTGR